MTVVIFCASSQMVLTDDVLANLVTIYQLTIFIHGTEAVTISIKGQTTAAPDSRTILQKLLDV